MKKTSTEKHSFIIKSLMIASFCTITASCGLFTPYVVSFRDMETESFKGNNMNKTASVSVCYDSLSYSLEDADKLAAEECAIINAEAKFISSKNLSCSLFSPDMANYICIDKETKNPVVFTSEYRKERLLNKEKPVF